MKIISPVLLIALLLVLAPASHAEDSPQMRFGGQVVIDEDVTGDLIVFGGQITVNGDVDGNLMVFGGQVTVNGEVTGDLLAAGGDVTVSGDVDGNLQAYGGNVQVNGVVEGDADLGGGNIILGSDAEIQGSLTYGGPQTPNLFEGKVAGQIKQSSSKVKEPSFVEESLGPLRLIFGIFGFVGGIVYALVLGALILYLFPKFATQATEVVKASPIKSGLIGLLMLAAVPVLVVLSVLTLVGWKISVILVSSMAVMLLISTFPVKLVVGEFLYNKAFNRKSRRIVYYAFGVIAYALIYLIPLVGWLTKLLTVLIGYGGLWILLMRASRLGGKIKV
ncbi:MAG: hypothetical protein V1921_03210 [Candidatus Altiarchaeota archaeon]